MLFKKSNAFTMIELIIVIVISGILSSIFIMNINYDPLPSDKKYIVSKIYEKKNNALKYSHVGSSLNWELFNNYNNTCLNLNIEEDRIDNGVAQFILEEIESSSAKKYFLDIRTIINITGLSSNYSKICFDSNGVPYDGNYQLNNKLKEKVSIKISFEGKEEYIYILPMTGAIIY